MSTVSATLNLKFSNFSFVLLVSNFKYLVAAELCSRVFVHIFIREHPIASFTRRFDSHPIGDVSTTSITENATPLYNLTRSILVRYVSKVIHSLLTTILGLSRNPFPPIAGLHYARIEALPTSSSPGHDTLSTIADQGNLSCVCRFSQFELLYRTSHEQIALRSSGRNQAQYFLLSVDKFFPPI